MGGSGDQLSLDNTQAYSGNNSLKIKRSTAGNMRYLQWDLYKGTGVAHTGYNNFGVFIKNPNNFAIGVIIMVYKVNQVTPSNQGATSRAQLESLLIQIGQNITFL